MHNNTIDWIREINISADAALAKKYWGTAAKLGEVVDRKKAIDLLRLFLFVPADVDLPNRFTKEIRAIDGEFKGKDNVAELRLMAGLVMVSQFDKPSHAGDTFALGIRSAAFTGNRCDNFLPAINEEAEKYLLHESNRCRPDHFADDADEVTKGVAECKEALNEAGDDERQAAFDALQLATAEAIVDGYSKLSKRVEQLAEESGLLWWVLTEYSDLLKQPVSELTQQSYSLVLAAEAAMRTRLLPPPPSIGPLLARALTHCKASKKQLSLADYLDATNTSWRASQLKSLVVGDCFDLVPLCAALAKTSELGDVKLAMGILPKICPGISGGLPLPPFQAALQFYNELLFVRSFESL